MLSGNLEHRLEAQAVEIDRVARTLVVSLVDGKNDWLTSRTKLACDLLVSREQPLATVDQHDQQVGAGYRAFALLDHEFVQWIFAGAKEAARIEDVEGRALPLDRTRER